MLKHSLGNQILGSNYFFYELFNMLQSAYIIG
jgi:hypothetical protein